MPVVAAAAELPHVLRMEDYAYITYANSPVYVHGALVVATCLERVGSKYPLLLMVPADLDLSDVQLLPNVRLVPVPALEIPADSSFAFDRFRCVVNKMYLWKLTQYDKLCWVDSDMILLDNIDELFNIPLKEGELAAASGCTCNYFRHPKFHTRPEACPFNNRERVYINSGLFLAKPSEKTFERLLVADYNHPLPEQDAYNIVFEGRIRVLEHVYNFLHHVPLPHPDLSADDAKVFHFVHGKPWEGNKLGIHQEFYQLWKELSELTIRKQCEAAQLLLSETSSPDV